MAISAKTMKMLWGRAAARCSMPDCRIALVVDETETDDEALIGELCHIVAESEDGPRGASPLTREQRDKYDNLILLCRNHHGEIDAQPAAYSVERLRAIKATHEKWVQEGLPGYDTNRQRDDEIWAGYVDAWVERCDLDHWTDWSSWILGGGQPQMTIERDRELERLRTWLLRRIWPTRYPSLERAFLNFRLVLGDFQNTFREHGEKPHPQAEWLLTRKFYQIREWDEERYEKLGREFEFHVDLVQDLMLELTRAANLICDEVRSSILRTFKLERGRLSVLSGPHSNFSWREAVVQYAHDEKAATMPYPGRRKFMEVRATRDMHFGKGVAPL